MQIDWFNFTPVASLAGGIILGIAAGLLILLNGRILGISGILAGLTMPKPRDIGWRIAFLSGLASAPLIFNVLYPAGFADSCQINADYRMIVIAGILVGFGTRLGSGCTSGHGVCGLSRLSPRSMLATAIFMTTGFLILFIIRHML